MIITHEIKESNNDDESMINNVAKAIYQSDYYKESERGMLSDVREVDTCRHKVWIPAHSPLADNSDNL